MSITISKKAQNISPSITLAISAKAKQMKEEGIDVISFGVGEPDFDTPANIKNAAIEAIKQGHTKYTPASGLPQLKKAICAKLKSDNNLDYGPENIIVSNGAKHSLYNIFQAICNPEDEVIIPAPYWVSFPEMVKMADANPVIVNCTEENEFKITTGDLLNAITSKTKAIILNSPSNPTGSIYTRAELEEIARIAVEHNIFVITDEVYEKLVYDGEEHISIASLNEKIKDLTITVNAMSKCYAMTGWRIGYTASHENIAKAMNSMQSHATSNPNSIAQHASIEGLTGDQSSVEEMRLAFDERRKYMVRRVNEIKGLSCIVPKGAFYIMMNIKQLIGTTVKGTTIDGSMDFSELLLEHANVAVVPGIAFGVDEFVRLSYANSLENIEEALNRIDALLND